MRSNDQLMRRDFLKLTGCGVAGAVLFPRLGKSAAPVFQGSEKAKPNIIVILTDDLGFETVNCYGGTSYKTPNIDALARSGIRFTKGYATPLCSPSRAELMTGRYGFRTGWVNLIGRGDDALEFFDPQKEQTFGHVMRNAGYATAIAGKWQFCEFPKTPNHAQECGFDESSLWTWRLNGKHTSRYWDPSIWENGKLRTGTEGKYGDDVFSDFLIDFMKRHKDSPFFAYYPQALVHSPFTPTPDSKSSAEEMGKWNKRQARQNDTQGRSGKRQQKAEAGVTIYPDMVAYMDKCVGRIVKAVDDLGLRENTVIIFTGDNGTDRAIVSRWNGQSVPGGKGTVTEFGTHVPFIVSWRGTTPAGVVSDNLVDFSDVLPTLAELGGASLPSGVTIDGRSLVPQLRGQMGQPREWIFSQLGHERLVRDARFMLDSNGRLFDVEKDPFGKADLAASKDPTVMAAKAKLLAVLDRMK